MNKTITQQEDGIMALVKMLHGGMVTVPAEARKALRLDEGTYLEAAVVDGELRLRPVNVVDRKKAWDKLMALVEEDKWVGPEPRPSPEEEERWIFDVLNENAQ